MSNEETITKIRDALIDINLKARSLDWADSTKSREIINICNEINSFLDEVTNGESTRSTK